jgi:hypothetical protein
MPNKRRAGQFFLGVQIDARLAADLDRARGRKDRSQFVREAVAEKLKRLGVPVPDDLIYPPPRAKVIQIIGNNNRNITQRAAEKAPKYRAKKKGKKKWKR